MENCRLTERLKRVIDIAKEESLSDGCQHLHSGHILRALLIEDSGVLSEVRDYLKERLDTIIIYSKGLKLNGEIIYSELFCHYITCELQNVLDEALLLMKRYKQVYLNEGHILKVLIRHLILDHFLNEYELRDISKIAVISRDLYVNLETYEQQTIESEHYVIRRAEVFDTDALNEFIRSNFNEKWAINVNKAFSNDKITIFIAQANGDIVGFAGYDIVRKEKGVFGPMGVAHTHRSKGIGKELIQICFSDMKSRGYKDVIIDDAGPIEFYEKCCGAKLTSLDLNT